MPEKDNIFKSKTKYEGLFVFRDFYKFAYEWLSEEANLLVIEKKYEEKIKGVVKEIVLEWNGTREVTDFFKFEFEIKMTLKKLVEKEILKDGKKIKTNEGSIKIELKGNLIKDYEGKFETNAFYKFIRGVYERWVIPSRIEEYKEKVIELSNEFLNQVKDYLDMEGNSE